MKGVLHEGNITRVIVKDDRGKVLLEIPANVSVVGTVIALWLAALGAIAAQAANYTIVVEKKRIARFK